MILGETQLLKGAPHIMKSVQFFQFCYHLGAWAEITKRGPPRGAGGLNFKAVLIISAWTHLLGITSSAINQYLACLTLKTGLKDVSDWSILSKRAALQLWSEDGEIFKGRLLQHEVATHVLFVCAACERLRSHRKGEEPATTEASQSWSLIHRWHVTSLDGE